MAFGQTLGNSLRTAGDVVLGSFGASNVIGDESYAGPNAERWNANADVAGGVGAMAAPIAASLIGGPMAGMAVSGVQQIGSGLNPESKVASPGPYYNNSNMNPNYFAPSYAYGGYVRGRLRGYAQGDFIPYEQTTETFDTTSWSDPYRGAPVSQNYTGQNVFGQAQNFGIPSSQGYTTSYSNPWGINPNAQQPINQAAEKSGINPYIAAGTLAQGLYQTIQAQKGLKKLGKETMPTISASPQLQQASSRAQEMAKRGYTPEEEAVFKQNLSQAQNTAYRNAISQSGGNLAQAINAGLQSQNIGALNQFAAEDAAKRQANIRYADSFADRFQGIQDENTRNALQYRLMRERALGEAGSQGMTNLATGLNAALASTYKG